MAKIPRYRSPAALERAVVWALLIAIALWILDFIWSLGVWQRIGDAREYERQTGAGVQWQGHGESSMGSALDVLAVVTPVLFVLFFWRAYTNLEALGVPRLRFEQSWAVAGWLIPVIAFFRPKQIADDIWRGSDPAAPPEQEPSWCRRPVPVLLDLWWVLWIVAAWMIRPADWLNHGVAKTTEQIAFSMLLEDAAMVAFIVSAVFAVVVVVGMSRRQQERAERLGLTRPAPVAAARA